MICDKEEWRMPDDIKSFVNELVKNSQICNEEKILLIYEKICKDYIYDDNVLSYIKKYDDDKFGLPDFYGRDTDLEWKENRKKHKRRNCFEVSRILAKSLMELFKNNDDYNICILYDIDLAHYFVGLICDEYSMTLDVDDFNKIKDLTRVKTGLTIEGISILEDNKGKFKNALDNFNKDKDEHAVNKIESEVNSMSNLNENVESDKHKNEGEIDEIIFMKSAIEILKDEYDIDSQGLFEYMKEIIDIRFGPEARDKVWKKIEGNSKEEVRYTRCLTIDVNNQKYLIDSDKKEIRLFDEKELTIENGDFIPYKNFSRDWDEDRYNGI